MNCLRKHSVRRDNADEYATSEDFRKVFTEKMDGQLPIRDLNSGPGRADENNDIAAFVLCAIFFILLLWCLAFVWFYPALAGIWRG